MQLSAPQVVQAQVKSLPGKESYRPRHRRLDWPATFPEALYEGDDSDYSSEPAGV